jgi:hypothetical protein
MKATKAYIASLGTTGLLLGASILMLAVVSAVVAFDQWPDGNVSTRVQTLMLHDNAAPIRVSARSPTPSSTPAGRAPAGRAGARAGGTRGTTGGTTVGGGRVTGGTQAPSAAPVQPIAALPPATTAPLQPVQDTATPIYDSVSNPGTTTSRVADGAQAVTDAAGGAVGSVSPQLGGALAGVGQAAAQTLRELPLPDHVLP